MYTVILKEMLYMLESQNVPQNVQEILCFFFILLCDFQVLWIEPGLFLKLGKKHPGEVRRKLYLPRHQIPQSGSFSPPRRTLRILSKEAISLQSTQVGCGLTAFPLETGPPLLYSGSPAAQVDPQSFAQVPQMWVYKLGRPGRAPIPPVQRLTQEEYMTQAGSQPAPVKPGSKQSLFLFYLEPSGDEGWDWQQPPFLIQKVWWEWAAEPGEGECDGALARPRA